MTMPHALVPLSRKLQHFGSLRPEDIAAIGRCLGRPHVLGPRTELDLRRGTGNRAFLIEEGWAYTYKPLKDGSRQVIDVGIAGDILGMRALMMRHCDHSAATITSAILYEFDRNALETIFRTAPTTATGLLWASSLDESLVAERLVDIGRRTAAQRVAHFLLELKNRLAMVGLCNGASFRCPLSQSLMADALGLTPIHLNRTMRQLRESDLLVAKDGIVTILNERGLIRLSGYDSTYLDGIEMPAQAAQ